MIKDSVVSVRKLLTELEVDALLFLNLHNIRQVTGFSGSDGAAIITRDAAAFLTDSRYTTQAGLEVSGFEIIEYQSKIDCLVAYLEKTPGTVIGFEGEEVTVSLHDALSRKLPGKNLQPLGRPLHRLRIIKSANEAAELRATAAIASRALISLLPSLKPGIREKDLALDLEFAMRRAGADDKSFDFIVASGVRGALPHGKAGEKIIRAGELVTIDFGAIRNGYCSDETVTVAVGEPDELQRKIYGIVKDAHDRALDAVRPGVSCRDIDAIARTYIDEHGYGSYFGHGLGHGVGLEVHEKPVLSFRSEDVVEEGMVFTIEPGIYIPDWGGVRIEDTVLVTADGCTVLTEVPKDLTIL